MMSDDSAFEELLIGSFQGDEAQGAGPAREERSPSETCDGATLTSPAVPLEGAMYCGGCGDRVWDRFILFAAGQVWHGSCLRCSLCQCELQTHTSLYCRDGRIYCQQDYRRLFSVGRCARCSQPIPSSALVMRSGALTFHPQCFTCQECHMTLLPGNLYGVQGRNLYCEFHYFANSTPSLTYSQHVKPKADTGDGEEPVSSPEPRLEDGAAGGGTQGRPKRIRTCFRSEQLKAMESYFALKHNPDGKDWSCLSHKTGLPKRVLQVWFQNARAKLRRSLHMDESRNNSPVATPADAMATASTSMTASHQSQAFETSTIDQLELSLLTAPLDETPHNPSQQHQELKESFYLGSDDERAGLSPLTDIDFV